MEGLQVGDTVNIDLEYQWWFVRYNTTVNYVRRAGHFGWTINRVLPLHYVVIKDGIEARIPFRFVSRAK